MQALRVTSTPDPVPPLDTGSGEKWEKGMGIDGSNHKFSPRFQGVQGMKRKCLNYNYFHR